MIQRNFNFKSLLLALVSAACLFLATDLTAYSQNSEQPNVHLLVLRNTGEVVTVDVQGNESIFLSELLPYERHVNISPTHDQVGVLDSTSIKIYDIHGDVVSRYSIPEEERWRLWGWKDEYTIVVSQQVDDDQVFYTGNVSADAMVLTEFESLNEFTVWDEHGIYSELSYGGIDGLETFFHFSPDFRYVVTPTIPFTREGHEELLSDPLTLSLWNIEDHSTQVLPNSVGFDILWTSNTSVWSKSGDQVVYTGRFSQDKNIYIFDVAENRLTVIPSNAPSCPICQHAGFAWSPTGRLFAHWMLNGEGYTTSMETSDMRQSAIIDGETITRNRFLLGLFVVEAHWSPDEKYIAVFEDAPFAPFNDPVRLTLINTISGQIDLTKEMRLRDDIIGWVLVEN
jgi:hypothetical protein